MSEYVLGIDLGTSTTTVSVVKDGFAQTIPIPGENSVIMPSVVSFISNKNEYLIGKAAKKRRIDFPLTTIHSIKRIMGRKFSDKETQAYISKFPYTIAKGENDSILVSVLGHFFTPQQISSFFLKKIKSAAMEFVGHEINDAVITVPANYNEAQRRATQEAGKLAELNVLRIVNEPTAAALAYGFGNNLSEKIVVFDFGGGTFDVTVLEVKDNFFEVLATGGDTFLGGDDIDNALVQFFIVDMETNFGVTINYDESLYGILTAEAERIKIQLSTADEVKVVIKNIVEINGEHATYERVIDKYLFEEIISPIVESTIKICSEVISNAHLSISEIDAIVLVGGSTKVPFVQNRVEEYFGKLPFLGIETELVISMGAAILGNSLKSDYNEEAPVLLDVVPASLGVGSIGDYVEIIVDKNEPLPIERTNIFTNAFDNQDTVKVEIFQGEKRKKSSSRPIGELILSDLRKAKRGELKIQVKFEIDTNGVMDISAIDSDTGKLQKLELNILGLEQ